MRKKVYVNIIHLTNFLVILKTFTCFLCIWVWSSSVTSGTRLDLYLGTRFTRSPDRSTSRLFLLSVNVHSFIYGLYNLPLFSPSLLFTSSHSFRLFLFLHPPPATDLPQKMCSIITHPWRPEYPWISWISFPDINTFSL